MEIRAPDLLETYRITRSLPADERFCLTSQMRRSALSIPANIVEGFRRRRPKDKIRFYNYSHSSLDELAYFYRVCKDLGYLQDYVEVGRLLESTGRMLTRLVQTTTTFPSF